MFYLDLAIREGNYCAEDEQLDPDPYIGLLNTDLTQIEEMIMEALPPRQARFIFEGLTQLMTSVLIVNLRHLKQVNKNGVTKLLNNVHSLQQNLIGFTLVQDQHLEKAKKYFECLGTEDAEFMEFVEKANGMFTYDEYMAILKLHNNTSGPIAQQLKEYFITHRA
jgi:exocyst complex component 4